MPRRAQWREGTHISFRYIKWLTAVVGLATFVLGGQLTWAQPPPPLKIYLDADFTVHTNSAMSIERGIRTALDEVENTLVGRAVQLLRKDHRGSTPRSLHHLKQFLTDPQALLVFSGLHSPPLLANREFINTQGILTLDPWAAAGPITRHPSKENWIFRLSIDDSKAGYTIVKHAIEADGFRKPFLLLEDTGWGKSNERTMRQAIKAHQKAGVRLAGLAWFNWTLGASQAKRILTTVHDSGADVILFVGGEPDGITFTKALLSFPKTKPIPIRSHWGITGGNFPQVITASMRKNLDLAFIQTSFSFLSQPLSTQGQQVLKRAQRLFPNAIPNPQAMKAPAGFIHAYDLTKLLIAAVQQTGLTHEMKKDQANIRTKLEHLTKPVTGLIKTYRRPFGAFTPATPDAHEALSTEDFTMGRYSEEGAIHLLRK